MKNLFAIMFTAGILTSCGSKADATIDGTFNGIADGVIIAKNLFCPALEGKVAEVLTGEKIEFPSQIAER